MLFTPYMEIYTDYEDNYDETRGIATNSYLKDGDVLYLMGGTVLCKYDISNNQKPKLLKKVDIAADHVGDPTVDYIRKECAHSTAIVDMV